MSAKVNIRAVAVKLWRLSAAVPCLKGSRGLLLCQFWWWAQASLWLAQEGLCHEGWSGAAEVYIELLGGPVAGGTSDLGARTSMT